MEKLLTIYGITKGHEVRLRCADYCVKGVFSIHPELPIPTEQFPILGDEKQYAVTVNINDASLSFTTTRTLSPDLVTLGWLD
jgi:hypothetical protein